MRGIDTRVRRGTFAVLTAAVSAVVSAVAAPAVAAEKGQHPFRYGTDVSSWYWERQLDEEVTPPVTLPPPAPPVSQRARLPSPQRPDTLPVGVFEAAHERMAAIKFDLSERGVTPGSTIKELVLRIEESTDKNEQPSVNVGVAKIQACVILDVLSGGENERFADRPQYSESDCVEGARETPPAPAAPLWTFDLKTLAGPWGEDPFANNGIMLLGILQGGGPTETWQVNLKIPARDDDGTEVNEYEQTQGRTTLTLDFVPGEDPTVPVGGSLDEGATGDISGGSGSIGGTFGGTPSTDLSGAGGPPVTPAAPDAPVAATPVAAVAPPEPRMPAFVWLLIPLGLMALSAVRSVVLEPAGGPRPGGAIEAIRLRNAQRRGGALRVPADPLLAAASALVALGRRGRAAGRAVGRWVTSTMRWIRRSR
jgi:hypothetical protein